MLKRQFDKADGLAAQLDRSIFSDDEDAVHQLKARIAERVAEVERCKAINKEIRKGTGWEGRITPSLTEHERKTLVHLATTWTGVYKPGYPSYHLTNLNARIRADRDRIAAITAGAARTDHAEALGGVLIEGDDWVRVTFAEKPERAVLDALRTAGFHWGAGSWIGRRDALPGLGEGKATTAQC